MAETQSVSRRRTRSHNLMGLMMNGLQRLQVREYHYHGVLELGRRRDPKHLSAHIAEFHLVLQLSSWICLPASGNS